MTSSLHLESALPSIACLVVISFLPWAARRSLSVWRALQVYDRQHSKSAVQEEAATAKKPSWFSKWKGLTIFLLVITVEMAFFVTSGSDWEYVSPIYAKVRHNVPNAFLIMMISGAIAVIIKQSILPVITISRQWDPVKKAHNIFAVKRVKADYTEPSKSNRLVSILVVLAYCAASMTIITLSSIINDQAPIYLAILSGVVSFTFLLPYQHAAISRMSFRGLIVYPLTLMMIGLAIIMVIAGVLFCVDFIAKRFKEDQNLGKSSKSSSSSSSTTGSPSSWGLENIDTDIDIAQLTALAYAVMCPYITAAPSVLICFAYRYDASRAGHATMAAKEVDQIVDNCTVPKDSSGKVAIPLSTVAIPRSTLSKNELPTFRAAFNTLVFIQVAGIAFDAITGWQGTVAFPTEMNQVSRRDHIAFSIWPLLAYPFVCIAMIVSVALGSDCTFKSLWTYGEQWIIPSKPATTSTATSATESQLEEAKEVEEVC